MKKFKSILALLLLGGLVVTGCEKKNKNPSDSGGSQQNGGGSQSGDSGSGDGGQQGGGSQQGGEGGGQQGGGEQGGGGQQGGGGEGGGQQGGGEVPADSQFVNKKFVFDSVSYPQNATIETALNQNYQGAYASFFQSGKFELVSVVNTYTMALLGTFTVADDDSYARLDVVKEYDGESEAYDYVTSGTFVTNIRYNEGLQKYVLPMRQEVEHNLINFDVYLTRSNEAPEPANLPDDPNGETFDPQYQVYKDVWDRLFVNRGLLHSSASNFKVTHDTTIFEIDNHGSDVSKFYEHWTTGSPNSGYYYERTSIVGNSYNYNFTIVAGGEVQPASPVEYGVDFFDSEVGLVPIPFNWMQYNSVGHYYFRNSYTYQNSFYGSRTVNNYRVYFGANYRVQQITYEDDAHQSFEFNFSNYNQVEINIPTAGGGSSIPSEDPTYYYQYIQNKVLTYDRVTNSDLTGDELEKAGEANSTIEFSVFNDRSVQIEWPDSYFKDGEKVAMHIVMYGSIEFTALTTLGSNQVVRATLSITNVVKDGVLQSVTPFTTQAHWYITDGQLRVKMFDDLEGDGSNYYVYLNPTNATPVAIPMPSGGGGEDPVATWPTDYISAALTTWGISNDSVPSIDVSGVSLIVTTPSAGVTVDDEYFTVVLMDGNKGSAYESALTTAGYSEINDYYVTSNKEISIKIMSYSEMLTINVWKGDKTGTTYPSASITSFLTNVTDNVPSFETEHASRYTFEPDEKYATLTIYYDDVSYVETEFAEFYSAVKSSGYGLKNHEEYAGYTLVSPNRQVGIEFGYYVDGGYLYINFYNFMNGTMGRDFKVDYTFTCTNDYLFNDGAVIYAFVMGGSYGEGQWFELYVYDVDNRVLMLNGINDDATSVNIVRFVPSGDPDWEPNWSNLDWYNQTDDIDISGNQTEYEITMHNRP